jgi:hypothetical protein
MKLYEYLTKERWVNYLPCDAIHDCVLTGIAKLQLQLDVYSRIDAEVQKLGYPPNHVSRWNDASTWNEVQTLLKRLDI